MRHIRMIYVGVLFLLCGVLLPAYGQRDHRDEKQSKSEKNRPQKQRAVSSAQQHRSEAKAEERGRQQRQVEQREHARPAQHPQPQRVRESRQQHPGVYSEHMPRTQQSRSREQAIVWQKERGWVRHGGWQGHSTWQQTRARRWKTEHRTWAQRGGYGGYHIPEDRFRVYFGHQHWFRIHSRPVIYMGYPRFVYGGFSFLLVDPWPESWAYNWYETNDVYIDYDSGYYLCDRRDPGIRLAITVLVN